MSLLRPLLTLLAVVGSGLLLLMVGFPVAVHTAAALTPTGYDDEYAWTTPALITQFLQGAPVPGGTLPCLIILTVFGVLAVLVLWVGVFGYAGRASILRLRAYVWWKSKPSRAPLTARHSAPLGRVGWVGFFGVRWFTDLLEEMRIMIAPSGSGKTVRLVLQLIHRARGPVVNTSTKAEVIRLTAWIRKQRFPDSQVRAFDPEGLVPWMAQIKWDIVAGCEDEQMAIKRAVAIVAARPLNGDESTNTGFFSDAAAKVLQCMLHAAAVKNLSMREVIAWMNDFDDDTPYDILRHTPGANHSWEATLRKFCRGKAEETVSATDMTSSGILNAFTVGQILDTVCPGKDDVVLDLDAFPRSTDTLYLVCKGETSPAASVFTALIESLYLAASDAVTRADEPICPPLELVLDEFANLCAIPSTPALMSTGRGEGIVATLILQNYGQLKDRFGKTASTILENATELLVLGGSKDTDYLEDLSKLAGDLTTFGGGRADRVMTPARIRTLWDGRALFFYRNQPPAVLTLPAWWRTRDRADYEASIDWASKAKRDYIDARTAAEQQLRDKEARKLRKKAKKKARRKADQTTIKAEQHTPELVPMEARA